MIEILAWLKRSYALNIAKEWNVNTAGHLAALETAYPNIMFSDGDQPIDLLDEVEARKVYLALVEKKEAAAHEAVGGESALLAARVSVRQHIVELLNFFDYVAMAHNLEIGAPEIIRDTLGPPLRRWASALRHFLNVASTLEREGNPWRHFTDFVSRFDELGSASAIR